MWRARISRARSCGGSTGATTCAARTERRIWSGPPATSGGLNAPAFPTADDLLYMSVVHDEYEVAAGDLGAARAALEPEHRVPLKDRYKGLRTPHPVSVAVIRLG